MGGSISKLTAVKERTLGEKVHMRPRKLWLSRSEIFALWLLQQNLFGQNGEGQNRNMNESRENVIEDTGMNIR